MLILDITVIMYVRYIIIIILRQLIISCVCHSRSLQIEVLSLQNTVFEITLFSNESSLQCTAQNSDFNQITHTSFLMS